MVDKQNLKEGTKNDSDKVRMDLISPVLVWAVGKVLTFGAAKYDDRNWEKGILYGRVYGALMRHLWAWWGGEKFDNSTEKGGSGLPHLYHAACCLMFLMHYEDQHFKYQSYDDRPNKSGSTSDVTLYWGEGYFPYK